MGGLFQTRVAHCTYISKQLALVVLGSDAFANASEKCFNLMSRSSSILYLSSNLVATPRANSTATRANLNWAITSWLKDNSDQNTQIWIWVFADGYGLYHRPRSEYYSESWMLDGGRPETNSDEGPEITEATLNVDVNKDGSIDGNTWIGVDECFALQTLLGEELVWDDDLSQWCSVANYRSMIVFMSTCKTPDALASCYGAGFIDDLSAPRRVIISPTNETYPSWANHTTGVGWFEDLFMDALTPGTKAWGEACNLIGDESEAYPFVTSILEAFIYARENDMARMVVRNPSGDPIKDPFRNIYYNFFEIDETPWLDDGGNFLPTFRNEMDLGLNVEGYDTNDGALAMYTWLEPWRYIGSRIEDTNTDWIVDIFDLSTASSSMGCVYPQEWTSTASIGDVNKDNTVDIFDIVGIALVFGWHGNPP